MKWAAANTRLSFDTETLNSLRADIPSPLTPSALEQRDKDGSAGEVGRGTRIPGVALVPQLAVERRYVLRSEEHTSELQSQSNLVCRLLLEKKKASINGLPFFFWAW